MFNIDLKPIIYMALLGCTLGVWKLVEIIIWIIKHVRIVIQ